MPTSVAGIGRDRTEGRSEDAFAHEDQVVRTDRIVELGLQHLDVAVTHATVQADATVGTTQGQTTALGNGLGHGHAAVKHVLARTLDLAIHIVVGGLVDEDGVASLQDHVLAQVAGAEHLDQVDLQTLRTAVAGGHEQHVVGAGLVDAARHREDLGQAHAGGLQRVAAGVGHVAQHRDLLAAELQHVQGDLRVLQEAALTQTGGDEVLGLLRRQAGQLDHAQQRVGDDAAFGDAGLDGQILGLEDLDAQHVTRPEQVVTAGGLGHGLGRCQTDGGQGHQPQHELLEARKKHGCRPMKGDQLARRAANGKGSCPAQESNARARQAADRP